MVQVLMRCQDKKQYIDKIEAVGAAARLLNIKRTNSMLRAYLCNICGFWHLTHQVRKTIRKRGKKKKTPESYEGR